VDDIFFIRALEMDPANLYVHEWDFETHEARLKDPDHHYLVALNIEGQPLGYAILIENKPGLVEWKRIIVARRGDGIGRAFMQAVLDYFFETKATDCIWLDVYEQNDRARHVYEKLGFQETGEDLGKVPGERLVIMEYRPPA